MACLTLTSFRHPNACVQEAIIQGGADVPDPQLAIADRGYDFKTSGRVFKFLLKGPAGGKMVSASTRK